MTTVVAFDPIADRASWLEWRRSGVGGSDIAALCGMSPYASQMSLYLEKTGQTDEWAVGEAANLGRRFERAIAEEFEERSGLRVAGAQLCVLDDRADWRRCTLDGLVVEGPDVAEIPELAAALGVFESKMTGTFGYYEIPDEFQVQCQWQMGITGLPFAWLVILHPRRVVIHVIDFDSEMFEGLCRIADRFWHDHVLAKNPPPADATQATTAALKDAFRDRATDTEVELDDELMLVARALPGVRAAVKRAEADRDLVENQLRAALGEATVGTYTGEPVLTWKQQNTAAPFDREGLVAAHPRIAAKFTGAKGTTRVLRPTKALKEIDA